MCGTMLLCQPGPLPDCDMSDKGRDQTKKHGKWDQLKGFLIACSQYNHLSATYAGSSWRKREKPDIHLTLAEPPDISTVSLPVSARRSPLGVVMKQPEGQISSVDPLATVICTLFPFSAIVKTISPESMFVTLAAIATFTHKKPMMDASKTVFIAIRRMAVLC